ncbi:MAG: chemotaxis protein CheW [Verrucomicrobia bacterium]|nr:MAG: chemotaxis protein CheW [Verrucomicrobiota bacterium]
MLFLLFQIGNDRYALEAQQAVEVLPLVELKRVPQAPRGVAGLFNYRGRPVPAIDLSELTASRPARELLSTRIILVPHTDEAGRVQLIGLIAERATELLRRDQKELVPPAPPTSGYLGPVLMDEKGLVQLIQPQRLLTGEILRLTGLLEHAGPRA